MREILQVLLDVYHQNSSPTIISGAETEYNDDNLSAKASSENLSLTLSLPLSLSLSLTISSTYLFFYLESPIGPSTSPIDTQAVHVAPWRLRLDVIAQILVEIGVKALTPPPRRRGIAVGGRTADGFPHIHGKA